MNKFNELIDSEIKQLSQELRRKESALAETAALLVLRKKAHAIWGGQRGRMIKVSDRKESILLIKEAVTTGAREPQACNELGISQRTLQVGEVKARHLKTSVPW